MGRFLSPNKQHLLSAPMGVAETVASDLYETVLQCGTLQIPWIGLENTPFSTTGVNLVVNAKVHDHTTTSGLQGPQMHLAPPEMSGVAGLQSLRDTNPNSAHRTLYHVLKNFREYQATDPRDMVFSLVGVQYDSRDTIPVSDYTRTVEELCTLVTYLMIRKYGINILCEAGHTNRPLDHTSSWTIDWYANRSSSVWTWQQACDERGKVSPRSAFIAWPQCLLPNSITQVLTSTVMGPSDPLQSAT